MQADPMLAAPRHKPCMQTRSRSACFCKPVLWRIHFSSAALISSVHILDSFQPSLGEDYRNIQEGVSLAPDHLTWEDSLFC